jgi:hypothetical protein
VDGIILCGNLSVKEHQSGLAGKAVDSQSGSGDKPVDNPAGDVDKLAVSEEKPSTEVEIKG